MKKTINEMNVEGIVYSHNLEERKTGPDSKSPNTPFIRGTLNIATDAEKKNIIPVQFIYVPITRKNKNGVEEKSRDYEILKGIIDKTEPNYMENGDDAIKVRIFCNITVDEYCDRNDITKIISRQSVTGSYINKVSELSEDEKVHSKFKTDILIEGLNRVDADLEKDTPEKLLVKGYIFNYKNAFYPCEFVVYNPKAMTYFEDLEPSKKNPIFTCVWGRYNCSTVTKRIVNESAFGEDDVTEKKTYTRDFVITGANPTPYTFDEDGAITAMDIINGMAEKETRLATVIKNRQDYEARKGASSANIAKSSDEFDF